MAFNYWYPARHVARERGDYWIRVCRSACQFFFRFYARSLKLLGKCPGAPKGWGGAGFRLPQLHNPISSIKWTFVDYSYIKIKFKLTFIIIF